MSHNIGISLLAILPALALGAFIYAKDRGDKEPFSLLALLFGAGAAAYIPLYFIEKWITGGIDALFLETHFDPEQSPSDGPNMLPLDQVGPLLKKVCRIRRAIVQ